MIIYKSKSNFHTCNVPKTCVLYGLYNSVHGNTNKIIWTPNKDWISNPVISEQMKQPDTEHSVEKLNHMGQSDTFIMCSFLSHTGSYEDW